jgi:N-formylglutamate amidohydrolase
MMDLDNQQPFSFRRGTLPLLVSIPHNGAFIPSGIAAQMTEDGRSSRDTDWFLDRLYDVPELQPASVLVANISRYVIDLNRPPDDQTLYPGQTTTGLIPEICFDGAMIYQGPTPGAAEIDHRIDAIWKPYHAALANELDRLRGQHGFVCLLEAHSIKSRVPRLFDGPLPDFNIGTNHDRSCQPQLTEHVVQALKKQERYSHVVNARFVGGYITRHYGAPDRNTHALQIELSQATYLNETTLKWDVEAAKQVQITIQEIVQSIMDWISQQ